MAISLADDFKDFLKLLNSNEVEYLLIGGYAVSHFGYARSTGDMDIWVSNDSENSSKLVIVLQTFGFDLPEVTEELFQQEDRIIRMGYPPIRIEVLTSISAADPTSDLIQFINGKCTSTSTRRWFGRSQ